MGETILITGGSGFIGLELAKSLIAEGSRIVVFDLKPPKPLPEGASLLTFVPGDITNLSQVLNVVREHRPAGIIHLAALLSEPSERNPWASISINGLGTYHVLEAARLFETRKVLFSSSMAVYVRDGFGGRIVTEETPQRPTMIYGITKVFSELIAHYYHRKFGVDTRGIRLPVLVGPHVESGGFGQFNSLMIEAAILGKPFDVTVPEDAVIPLLYIKDAVRSLAMLYRAPAEALVTRIYNIGHITPPPSTGDIVGTVRKYCPDAQLTFRPDHAGTEVARNSPLEIRCDEATKEWGWSVEYSLEDMVKDFMATFNNSEEN